ncbi:hypothetical protein EYS14_14345 [Alteromonadaceae bacterium M269]|nr:hypothetical protein EYS14_14345 [Alteromonadaceae bacterium M269]
MYLYKVAFIVILVSYNAFAMDDERMINTPFCEIVIDDKYEKYEDGQNVIFYKDIKGTVLSRKIEVTNKVGLKEEYLDLGLLLVNEDTINEILITQIRTNIEGKSYNYDLLLFSDGGSTTVLNYFGKEEVVKVFSQCIDAVKLREFLGHEYIGLPPV